MDPPSTPSADVAATLPSLLHRRVHPAVFGNMTAVAGTRHFAVSPPPKRSALAPAATTPPFSGRKQRARRAPGSGAPLPETNCYAAGGSPPLSSTSPPPRSTNRGEAFLGAAGSPLSKTVGATPGSYDTDPYDTDPYNYDPGEDYPGRGDPAPASPSSVRTQGTYFGPPSAGDIPYALDVALTEVCERAAQGLSRRRIREKLGRRGLVDSLTSSMLARALDTERAVAGGGGKSGKHPVPRGGRKQGKHRSLPTMPRNHTGHPPATSNVGGGEAENTLRPTNLARSPEFVQAQTERFETTIVKQKSRRERGSPIRRALTVNMNSAQQAEDELEEEWEWKSIKSVHLHVQSLVGIQLGDLIEDLEAVFVSFEWKGQILGTTARCDPHDMTWDDGEYIYIPVSQNDVDDPSTCALDVRVFGRHRLLGDIALRQGLIFGDDIFAKVRRVVRCECGGGDEGGEGEMYWCGWVLVCELPRQRVLCHLQ